METVRASHEIERMFAEGRRASHPLLVMLATETPSRRGPRGRVAFIAGKRLGGAVVRNRAKRVMREAARHCGPWPGWDVALIARPDSTSARADELEAAMRGLAGRLGLETQEG